MAYNPADHNWQPEQPNQWIDPSNLTPPRTGPDAPQSQADTDAAAAQANASWANMNKTTADYYAANPENSAARTGAMGQLAQQQSASNFMKPQNLGMGAGGVDKGWANAGQITTDFNLGSRQIQSPNTGMGGSPMNGARTSGMSGMDSGDSAWMNRPQLGAGAGGQDQGWRTMGNQEGVTSGGNDSGDTAWRNSHPSQNLGMGGQWNQNSQNQMQNDWNSAFAPNAGAQQWAGGNLSAVQNGSRTWTGANGQTATYNQNSDMATLARRNPAIASQWYNQYGYNAPQQRPNQPQQAFRQHSQPYVPSNNFWGQNQQQQPYNPYVNRNNSLYGSNNGSMNSQQEQMLQAQGWRY